MHFSTIAQRESTTQSATMTFGTVDNDSLSPHFWVRTPFQLSFWTSLTITCHNQIFDETFLEIATRVTGLFHEHFTLSIF